MHINHFDALPIILGLIVLISLFIPGVVND